MKADFERALLEQATEHLAPGWWLTSGYPRMLWPHEPRGRSLLVDGGEAKCLEFPRSGSKWILVLTGYFISDGYKARPPC